MNIEFKKIAISNFRSIKGAAVDLQNQGTVIVKGINEYEDKATSNGSGKSSVFEAIIFTLFEETSSGEKNVSNRITGEGYILVLDLEVDGVPYKILRECKGGKSTVVLYKNDVDISARNKTDTNKLICSILGINKDIFLDSVFLSQNVSTNLASLSPTGRKERLEVLTSTDSVINTFKEKLKEQQNEYEALCVTNEANLNKLQGNKDTLLKQKIDIQQKIEQIDVQIQQRNLLGNIDDINKQIEENNKQIEENNKQIEENNKQVENQEILIQQKRNEGQNDIEEREKLYSSLTQRRQEYSNIQLDINNIQNEIVNLNQDNVRIDTEINDIKNSDICPTCGRKYENVNEEHLQLRIRQFELSKQQNNTIIGEKENNIKELTTQLESKKSEGDYINNSISEINIKIDDHNQEITSLENEKLKYKNIVSTLENTNKGLQDSIKMLQDKKDQINNFKVPDKTEFENMLKSIDTDILKINDSIKINQENYESNNNYVGTVKHILQLITKEFRTYLLQNSIQYLNNLLHKYSNDLFSNEKDIIVIDGDDTKLNIRLGDATYESLSGGEKTRVNIALLLAQKSLASSLGNISSNIIILDEILGYCDSQAECNVIDLITKELLSLESIFMVSHKEIPIGYDNQLIVTKNKEGISTVRCY